MTANRPRHLGLLAFLATAPPPGAAASSSSDVSMYYQNGSYSWLSAATNIAMKVEGCVWSTTDDNEDMGCMEDGSSDGTTYWYQMAMCRRAQVAFSVYAATSGSSSCGGGDFKGTFVTQDGLAEFAYILSQYDQNSPISRDTINDLPTCEAGDNGYYLAVGCASDGSFTIDSFSDGYCTQRVSTYDTLYDVNYLFKSNFRSCYGIYDADYDQYVQYSTAGALISAGKACTALDSPLCVSGDRIDKVSSNKVSGIQSTVSHTISNFNIANKAKYAMGTLCLIGSLFMFLGILFTNRRKRRAMMHRKLRAAKRERAKRSGSKGRSSSSRNTSSRSRSRGGTGRSRSRAAVERKDTEDSGVYA